MNIKIIDFFVKLVYANFCQTDSFSGKFKNFRR